MKIAICVHNLANGGAERVASLWANGFAERGDEVTIILAEENAPIEYAVSEKVRICNIYAKGQSAVRYLRKIRNLRMLLRNNKTEVAIAVMQPFNIWLILATIGLKTRIVNTEHNSFEKFNGVVMSRTEKFYKFWLNKCFKAVTVLTAADQKVIGSKLKNVYVMPNPLTFTPCESIAGKEKIILACGRLDIWYVKGFDTLIEVWGKISDKHPDWQLCIAGRGRTKDEDFLKSCAEKHGVGDRMHLLGFCKDMQATLRKAAVFAFPSRYDGFGMALIEAMSQGCACVACDFKGRQGEIIQDGISGLLCQPEDVDNLVQALDSILSDEEKRTALQEQAILRSRDFSLTKVIDRWYDIFKQMGLLN